MTIDNQQKKRVLRMLAIDIRCNWGYLLKERQDVMIQLCEEIERPDLVKWIKKRFAAEYFDGRDLRDGFEFYDYESDHDPYREWDYLSEESKKMYGKYFTEDEFIEKCKLYIDEDEIERTKDKETIFCQGAILKALFPKKSDV